MPRSHIDQIRKLEEQFGKFRIMSSADMTIAGSLSHGYASNCPTCPEDDPNSECGGGGGGGTTGACCFTDGSCSIETAAQCATDGGTYQGDGTGCFPNPCPSPPTCDEIEPVTLCKCGSAPYHIVECGPPFTDFGYSTSNVLTNACSGAIRACGTPGGPIVSGSSFWLTEVVVETGRIPPPGGCDMNCPMSGTETFTYTTDITDPTHCVTTLATEGNVICDDPTGLCHPDQCECLDSGLPCSFISPCAGGSPCVPVVSHPVDITGDLSDEYTTAMLITNTLALLGTCPDGCVPDYTLNDDETCCTAFCVAA